LAIGAAQDYRREPRCRVKADPSAETRIGAVAPYRLWLRFAREDGDLVLLKPV